MKIKCSLHSRLHNLLSFLMLTPLLFVAFIFALILHLNTFQLGLFFILFMTVLGYLGTHMMLLNEDCIKVKWFKIFPQRYQYSDVNYIEKYWYDKSDGPGSWGVFISIKNFRFDIVRTTSLKKQRMPMQFESLSDFLASKLSVIREELGNRHTNVKDGWATKIVYKDVEKNIVNKS